MHAYLVNSYQQLVTIDSLEIRPEKSIGIAEVRQIQVFLARKPLQAKHNTVIIYDAHLLTLPAQNALLKTLEEPPANSQIYLITNYADQLLPTVLSRVQINQLTSLTVDQKDYKKSQGLLEKLLKTKVAERLRILDEVVFTRETALEFLSDVEHILHSHLDLPLDYDLIHHTRTYLKANCSVKLCMDNLILLLPQPSP